jgi:hypothetical protein
MAATLFFANYEIWQFLQRFQDDVQQCHIIDFWMRNRYDRDRLNLRLAPTRVNSATQLGHVNRSKCDSGHSTFYGSRMVSFRHPQVKQLIQASVRKYVSTVTVLAAVLLGGPRDILAEQAPLRIMPLGDSITQGYHDSYRRHLWSALIRAGFVVDFVGSMTHGYGTDAQTEDFDRDHEGHWGWRTDQVLAHIDTWAARAKPDIVLVHLGTNDIGVGQEIDETAREIESPCSHLAGSYYSCGPRSHDPTHQALQRGARTIGGGYRHPRITGGTGRSIRGI